MTRELLKVTKTRIRTHTSYIMQYLLYVKWMVDQARILPNLWLENVKLLNPTSWENPTTCSGDILVHSVEKGMVLY